MFSKEEEKSLEKKKKNPYLPLSSFLKRIFWKWNPNENNENLLSFLKWEKEGKPDNPLLSFLKRQKEKERKPDDPLLSFLKRQKEWKPDDPF